MALPNAAESEQHLCIHLLNVQLTLAKSHVHYFLCLHHIWQCQYRMGVKMADMGLDTLSSGGHCVTQTEDRSVGISEITKVCSNFYMGGGGGSLFSVQRL